MHKHQAHSVTLALTQRHIEVKQAQLRDDTPGKGEGEAAREEL